ncbi:hypothetical protein AVEN_272709-1 [Araneus ventricosus]|uniref:RNase H type-1 domain-containing protein n=1 Tax=Araneus ventricosus TaxID=182803 RepID=A0A4Y2LEK2_ARAVE|nr:hypothetical protein AVEN_272709-1 [Araneus ventricosus]
MWLGRRVNFPPWGIPVVQFLNPFKTFIKSDTAGIIYQQIFIEHRQEYNDFIAIYTDGSKSSDHGSFAVVFPNTTFSFKLHPSCSVFTAEIAAVLLALEQISDFLEPLRGTSSSDVTGFTTPRYPSV